MPAETKTVLRILARDCKVVICIERGPDWPEEMLELQPHHAKELAFNMIFAANAVERS